MDRLSELSSELAAVIEQLQAEAMQRNVRELLAPLAWLDEAHGWLNYELARASGAAQREPVAFTYIPIELRK